MKYHTTSLFAAKGAVYYATTATVIFSRKLTWYFIGVYIINSIIFHLYFDGSILQFFIGSCYDNVIKQMPSHWWTSYRLFYDVIDYQSNGITS